jgi:hypothetical protein
MPQRVSSDDPPAPSASSTEDTPTRGSRGPQGGAQSSSGGSGAASSLMLMVAFALITASCLRFVRWPAVYFAGADGYRLERPG